MKTLRLITDDGVSASFGLAADEILARRAGGGTSPPTLRLYTYASHCALAGRFQNIDFEIQVDFCRRRGIAINRRPTGGGAIIMGAGQLGVAFAIPQNENRNHGATRELMSWFSRGLVHALHHLGIAASFQRKNDLEVQGRKIAGLGIYRDPNGGLLFHASLLVDLDIELMLHVLKTPFEKISDKEIRTVAERITTIRRECAAAIELEAVRARVAESFRRIFGTDMQRGDFTPEELHEIDTLETEKYRRDDWIFQTTEVPDHFGAAKRKMPGGLLDIRVTMAGRLIKAVLIGGDFFASEQAIADVEANLRWHASDPAAIAQTLQRMYDRWPAGLEMIPREILHETICSAVTNALDSASNKPYGCFVSPGGAHG